MWIIICIMEVIGEEKGEIAERLLQELMAHEMILYVASPKIPHTPINLSELINKFRKEARNKISSKYQLHCHTLIINISRRRLENNSIYNKSKK